MKITTISQDPRFDFGLKGIEVHLQLSRYFKKRRHSRWKHPKNHDRSAAQNHGRDIRK